MGTIKLETDRLILDKFDINCVEKYFNNWMNDDRVCKYLLWHPHKNIDTTKQIVSEWINDYEKDDYFNWCITLKENNEPIGSISYLDSDDGNKRIGYCIGYDYWNNGIVTEALRKVFDYLFKNEDIKYIISRHASKNPASGKVMLKNNMKLVDIKMKELKCVSGIEDSYIYIITKEEYLNNKR